MGHFDQIFKAKWPWSEIYSFLVILGHFGLVFQGIWSWSFLAKNGHLASSFRTKNNQKLSLLKKGDFWYFCSETERTVPFLGQNEPKNGAQNEFILSSFGSNLVGIFWSGLGKDRLQGDLWR